MIPNRSGSQTNISASSSHIFPLISISSSHSNSHENILSHHSHKNDKSTPVSPTSLTHSSEKGTAEADTATNSIPSTYSGFHAVRFHGDQIVPPLSKPIKPRKRSSKRSTILKKLISSGHESMKRSSSGTDFFRRSSFQTAEKQKSEFNISDKNAAVDKAGASNREKQHSAMSGALKMPSPFGIDLDTEDDEMAQITNMSATPISRISSVNTVSYEKTARKGSTSGWLAPESWKVKTDR